MERNLQNHTYFVNCNPQIVLFLKELDQPPSQEQLAERVGTTKNYISRIENNASDIRLSTLMRIIREGLGGHLTLTMDI